MTPCNNSKAASHGREAEMRTLRDCYASLTHRERQILALVVPGLMAARLPLPGVPKGLILQP